MWVAGLRTGVALALQASLGAGAKEWEALAQDFNIRSHDLMLKLIFLLHWLHPPPPLSLFRSSGSNDDSGWHPHSLTLPLTLTLPPSLSSSLSPPSLSSPFSQATNNDGDSSGSGTSLPLFWQLRAPRCVLFPFFS